MTDDSGLERLLDLDELLVEVGGGFWVKIVAKRVPPDRARSQYAGPRRATIGCYVEFRARRFLDNYCPTFGQ